MSQSLHCILLHITFSTKYRECSIDKSVRPHLYDFIYAACCKKSVKLDAIGGTEDHIHLLISLPPSVLITDLIRDIKSWSTGWLKKHDKSYKDFAWQRGYGIFSLSKSAYKKCVNYIADQEKHHASITYQNEFERLLEKYEIDYNANYLSN